MFEMSFLKICLVFIVALIVFGPERLPKVARSFAHWLKQVRAVFAQIQRDIMKESLHTKANNEEEKKTKMLSSDQDSK